MKANHNYMFKEKKELCNNGGQKTKRRMWAGGTRGGVSCINLSAWTAEGRLRARVQEMKSVGGHTAPACLLSLFSLVCLERQEFQTSLQQQHLGTDTKVWLQVYNCIPPPPPFAQLPAQFAVPLVLSVKTFTYLYAPLHCSLPGVSFLLILHLTINDADPVESPEGFAF